MQTGTTMTARTGKPEWARAAWISEYYDISRYQLDRLADEGRVRRMKLGRARSARVLYRVADIEALVGGNAR